MVYSSRVNALNLVVRSLREQHRQMVRSTATATDNTNPVLERDDANNLRHTIIPSDTSTSSLGSSSIQHGSDLLRSSTSSNNSSIDSAASQWLKTVNVVAFGIVVFAVLGLVIASFVNQDVQEDVQGAVSGGRVSGKRSSVVSRAA